MEPRVNPIRNPNNAWATFAFESGFPPITFDVHLQNRGMVHEPVDGRQCHGLMERNGGS
jgi:hypothetical protein